MKTALITGITGQDEELEKSRLLASQGGAQGAADGDRPVIREQAPPVRRLAGARHGQQPGAEAARDPECGEEQTDRIPVTPCARP